MWMNLISTMCLRIRMGITVGEGAGGYEMQNSRVSVIMGDGGRAVNPLYCDADPCEVVIPYANYMPRVEPSDHIHVRALFNGVALEYLYIHLISPWFRVAFTKSGHSDLAMAVRRNYKSIVDSERFRLRWGDGCKATDRYGLANSTTKSLIKLHNKYNKLFKDEVWLQKDDDEKSRERGAVGWIRKIRMLEEDARDEAPDSFTEEGVLVFPTRFCFDVTFPVKGNEGIILRLRVGGMVKQRDGLNYHNY